MELISQHTKKIMEECKEKAREAGLRFGKETLEYIVTNKDLLDLHPKIMIPTLYDYWVHDIGVIRGYNIYKVYPHNPYETVINTRPAISFYNDNNPDWMNIFIFYHVLAHIDFFQNNIFFKKTWDYDFCGRALSDKRLISKFREKMGEEKRWVDYVIEFSRSIDNLAGYYQDLSEDDSQQKSLSERMDFYFNFFASEIAKMRQSECVKEFDYYSNLVKERGEEEADKIFLEKIKIKYVDFSEQFENFRKKEKKNTKDIIQYILEYSDFLNKPDNKWMKQVIEIVRNTAFVFDPQIRTKIINEGWASIWHEKLFLRDKRICGHEVDFCTADAKVTMMPRTGLNPYGLGKRLLLFSNDLAKKGKLTYEFQKIKDVHARHTYNSSVNESDDFLFYMRRNFNDFLLMKLLDKNNFQDFVNEHRLFVVGRKLDVWKRVWRYYIKSRNGEDYRNMVVDSLYHPPYIVISEKKANKGELYLDHQFEGRQLITKYIPDVLRGLVYLWGGVVKLETTIFDISRDEIMKFSADPGYKPNYREKRVLFELEDYKKSPKLRII